MLFSPIFLILYITLVSVPNLFNQSFPIFFSILEFLIKYFFCVFFFFLLLICSFMASGDNDVKLIGAWPSPFVMRARIALKLKSIDYQFMEEKFGSKSELLLKSNPVYKKIPVLIHGEKPICESLIIVQYIDELWSGSGPSILPSDPYDRAISRFWAVYLDDKVNYSLLSLFCFVHFPVKLQTLCLENRENFVCLFVLFLKWKSWVVRIVTNTWSKSLDY